MGEAKLGERLKAWTLYGTAGSGVAMVLVYFLGYLIRRFHLAALGVATDLYFLDELYLFEGARFLVHLLTAIPVLALLGLVSAALVYLPFRVLPGRWRVRLHSAMDGHLERLRTRWSTPGRLGLLGTVFAVAVILLAMAPWLLFTDLLLRRELPAPPWLQAVLLDGGGALFLLYLAGLLAAMTLSTRLAWLAWNRPGHSTRSSFLVGLLTCLVATEMCFGVVSYGVLTAGRKLPRVEGVAVFDGGRQGEVWWVVKGKGSSSFLVRDLRAGGEGQPAGWRRRLVVLPSADLGRVEILCHDPLLAVLYEEKRSCFEQ